MDMVEWPVSTARFEPTSIRTRERSPVQGVNLPSLAARRRVCQQQTINSSQIKDVNPDTRPRPLPPHILMASPTTAAGADQDRKGVRNTTPSLSSNSGNGFSNVVDHLAPGVTENAAPHIPKRHAIIDKIIHVQPLRKDEMQVRPRPPLALLLATSLYCADLPPA